MSADIYVCRACGGIEYDICQNSLCPDCAIPMLIVPREIGLVLGCRMRELRDELKDARSWRNLCEHECGTDDIAVLAGQGKLIDQLYRLVDEHHAEGVMEPNECPLCFEPKWKDVLNRAAGRTPAVKKEEMRAIGYRNLCVSTGVSGNMGAHLNLKTGEVTLWPLELNGKGLAVAFDLPNVRLATL